MEQVGARRLTRVLSAAMVIWIALLSPSRAADEAASYPSRPIHIIVGFTPGGGNDLIARIFGQKLSERLGRPVIIENKPGAGAIVATEYVAKAAPDGYTLLVGASGAITINPAVYAKLPYDPQRDLVPISEMASFPLMLVVAGSAPFKSVAELVAYTKANPAKANYSSASASFQLATELFKQKTGAPMQMIPYKGANDAVVAVIDGEVTATIADAGPVSGQLSGGQLRALAVATPRRLATMPDVPTMKEAGADVDAVLFSGILAPKGTPPEIIGRLEKEFIEIAKLPDVVAKLKAIGIDATGTSSEEFGKIIATDIARWAEVARVSGVKIE
jgi:tripartite-type tricarboxylate transporter receptor subunit TctC